MSEFFGNLRGSTDRKSDAEIAREGAEREVSPNIPVWHIVGSELYHPNKDCKKLKEEEEKKDEKGIAHHAIGRIFVQMNTLNDMIQRGELPPSIRLNETGRIELCTECDKRKIRSIPKDPYSAG